MAVEPDWEFSGKVAEDWSSYRCANRDLMVRYHINRTAAFGIIAVSKSRTQKSKHHLY
jgi:hypothetical protein